MNRFALGLVLGAVVGYAVRKTFASPAPSGAIYGTHLGQRVLLSSMTRMRAALPFPTRMRYST